MSRMTKWKPEKTKVKVVFRLQFHATHISVAGWDKLFISFIPADSGKATAKTTKANVRNGACKWGDPIYETTRLLQDTKTKLFEEKLYKFVVSMGSSRSSILGEAAINLADYADAQKPFIVALPLHGCDPGALLHVTVQLLTSKTGFREFEQQRELREKGFSTTTEQSSPDESSRGKGSPSEEALSNQMVKVNSKVRFRDKSKEHPLVEEDMGPSEEYPDSTIGFDVSSNTSGSLYTEKHDTSSVNEIDSLKSQSPKQEKLDPPDRRYNLVRGWSSDYSADIDLCEENTRLRGSLEAAELSINELKFELNSLQSNADEIGVQTQKFEKLLEVEIASSDTLSKEVSLLKSECSKLKEDLENLACGSLMHKEALEKDQNCEKVRWLTGILAVEDKIREIQNKACFGYPETNIRVFLSDLEALLGVLQDLKQENDSDKSAEFVSGVGFGTDLVQPELGMLHCLGIPGLVSHETDQVDPSNYIKGKTFELLRELDESKAERESLVKKMDQMECYYEALIHELEENQRQILGELQNLRGEHSICIGTVSSTKAEMETMRLSMNEHLLRFAEEKRNLDSLSKELERRAITAEASLKRARLNYSIAVTHLQKDLELLSSQVLSMFETNENVIKQGFGDASQPSFQGYPVKEQTMGGDVLLEDLKKNLHLQECLYRKVEEELYEMHFVNMHLDVYSKTLQETLLQASENVRHMKESTDEVLWQLELAEEAKKLFKERLQTAIDDICLLNEYNTTCIAKYNDIAFQNRILETDLENVTHENHMFSEKIAEWESLAVELTSYKSKYEAEKTELSNLLEKEVLEKGNLGTSISFLQEDLETTKTKLKEMATSKETLQTQLSKEINCLIEERDKFQASLSVAETEIIKTRNKSEQEIRNVCQKLEVSSAMVHKFQLEVESVAERVMRSSEVEEIYVQKHQELLSELNRLETEVEQLTFKNRELSREFLALGVVSDELERSKLILAELMEEKEGLVASLHKKTEESSVAALELENLRESLRSLRDELGAERSSKVDLENSINEKQAVLASLQKKSEESLTVSLELEKLRENLKSLHDELTLERSSKNKLENTVRDLTSLLNENQVLKHKLETTIQDLTSQLNDLNMQLVGFEKQNADRELEILALRDVAVELEMCKLLVSERTEEKQALVASLQKKSEKSSTIIVEIENLRETYQSLNEELNLERNLKNKLESTVQDLTSQLNDMKMQLVSFKKQNKDLEQEILALRNVAVVHEMCKLLESKFTEEKQALVASLQEKSKESSAVIVELENLRESFGSLNEELNLERSLKNMLESTIHDLTSQSNDMKMQLVSLEKQNGDLQLEILALRNAAVELKMCKFSVSALTEEKQALVAFLQEKSEESSTVIVELANFRESFRSLNEELNHERNLKNKAETTNQDLTSQLNNLKSQLVSFEKQNGDREQEILALRNVVDELERCKLSMAELTEEKQSLVASLHEISSVFSLELGNMRDSWQSQNDELILERSLTNKLENTIKDLTSQLRDKNLQLLNLEKQKDDFAQEYKIAMQEKQALIASLHDKTQEFYMLELEFEKLRESSKTKLESTIEDLTSELNDKNSQLLSFQKQKSELVQLQQLVSDLESEKRRTISHEESFLVAGLESELTEMLKFSLAADVTLLVTSTQYEFYTEKLTDQLSSANKCCSELQNKTLEMESTFSVCLAEQNGYMEANKRLLINLDSLRSDLDFSISENRALVNEVKALTAQVEESRTRTENVDLPMSYDEEIENLMASKEECEIEVAVLRSKLHEHNADTVDKFIELQNRCNELTSRLSEQILKTKEFKNLSIHLKELKDKAEAECIRSRIEKDEFEGPPLTIAQESLRIAFIKEQYETKLQELKQQLSMSKRHSEEMLFKLQDSLDEIESRRKSEASHLKKNEELGMKLLEMEEELQVLISEKREQMNGHDRRKAELECALISLECCKEEKQKLENSLVECRDEKSKMSIELNKMQELVENCRSPGSSDSRVLSTPGTIDEYGIYFNQDGLVDMQPEQNTLVSSGINGNASHSPSSKREAMINDRFRAQTLRSSMDRFNNELERMKNENLLHPQDDHRFDPKFPSLERELMQLRKANEELRGLFPLFSEYPGCQNALERVLALEIELAEALQTKGKSSSFFQSSFLKQHSDEQAIFQSFRDINDLIEEMLEIKGRFTTVETELQDMHDRYSQLSLQFAEVEGERQKLMMTLKNVRASSRKGQLLNRSSSASLGEFT